MFAPRYVKNAKALLKNARKLLNYKRDLLAETTIVEFEGQMTELRKAIRVGDRRAIDEAVQRLDSLAGGFSPPVAHAAWRENCEVFLVAIVIALGVRTYFLQPFTIPTGSMQPTLNGIIGVPTEAPPPNPLVRLLHVAWLGRNYINVVSQEDDMVIALEETKRFGFFSYTRIRCSRQTFMVRAPRDTLMRHFRVDSTHQYKAGEIIARGYINTGDHVFVDKFTYHFRHPRRDEVFVFKTTNIAKIQANLARQGVDGSQFYIKRLAGLPGDELRIDPPELFINGERARGRGFERVMKRSGGYQGYSNGPALGNHFDFVGDPAESLRLPPHHYFALGDNSYHSSDSRDWGTVPESNIMGRGIFVYWPFTSHWGGIR